MADGVINVAAAAKAAKQNPTPAKPVTPAEPTVTLTSLLGECEIVKGKETRADDDGGTTLHVGNVRVNLPLCGHVAAKIYMRQREVNGQAVVGFTASFPSQRLGGANARFAPIFRDVPQETRDAIATHWQQWYLTTSAEKRNAATVASASATPIIPAAQGLDIGALAGLAKKTTPKP